MGIIKLLFGFWAGWVLFRVARAVISAKLGQKTEEPKIKPNTTLELMACPYCGVYTTAPCTNADCPGR